MIEGPEPAARILAGLVGAAGGWSVRQVTGAMRLRLLTLPVMQMVYYRFWRRS